MDRSQKEAFVADFNQRLGRARIAVVADYSGIDVNEMNAFRKGLSELDGVEFRIVKNRLAKLALTDTAFTGLADILDGPNAVLLGYEDIVEACKAITAFAKDHKAMEVKGGALDGGLLSPVQVKALADLPPKEVLQAMLLGVLQGPSRNLVSLLANANRQILNVLVAYRDKQEAG